MNQDIKLTDLCGEHLLTGVDRGVEKVNIYRDVYEDCEIFNFTLDNVTYTAREDPNDGYRSSMEHLKRSDKPTTNVFAPVKVIAVMKPDDSAKYDVLQLIDSVTKKVVLEVGTDYVDDYYPCWVAHFAPENMACNALSTGLDGLRYALSIVKGRRILARPAAYLAAIDEIEIFLLAAIERVEGGESMNSTATVQ